MTTTTTQRKYNIPHGPKLLNGTQVLRNPLGLKELQFQPEAGINTLQDLILHSQRKHGKKEFIGTRNVKTGLYEYETFNKAVNKAVAIGSSLQNLNLLHQVSEYKNIPLKLIGIYAKNRAEWTICDMANSLYGYTMIPLYDTLGPESVSFVLSHSGITTCICSTPSIEILLKTEKLHNLRNIIALDDDYSKQTKDSLEKRGLKIISLLELIIKGKQNKLPFPNNLHPDSVFSFSYTSGTTGNPKGAMITHRNVLGAVTSHQASHFRYSESDIHMSYLPLPHIFERFVNVTCWLSGCKIAYYSGDMLKLREDFLVAKPSVLIIVPRLLNRFYEEINNFINRQPTQQKAYIEIAIQEKLNNLKSKETFTVFHPIYDEKIFNNIKQLFGGRLRAIISGSAPVSQKVLDFLKVVLCCNVNQGYGQTEGTGLECVQQFEDHVENNVGGIVQSLELKLEDVPEMGYLSTDKDEQGNPQPRGEICVRGHSVFLGYYKDEEKTAETIDSEGWLHSGDIGQILQSGGLRVIDRKKNIFKLSQGEYVSPEKIENIYIRARGVQEAFVHGDSLQSYCIAVLVPKPDEILKIALELNINQTDLQQLCQNPIINKFYINTIQEQGKKEGLFSFEQAQKIYLEPVSLAIHGCLTSSFKLQRHLAKQVFKKVIEQLYSTPLSPKELPRL